jgi:hypothetical protein
MLAFPHPLVRSACPRRPRARPARGAAPRRRRLVDDEVAVLHHRVAGRPALDAALADDLAGSPAGGGAASSGRAPRATSWLRRRLSRIARRAAGGCSSR